jgi:hypothetical protein
MGSERKQGLSAEQVPVSAYGGSSKNLTDLKDLEGPKGSFRFFSSFETQHRRTPEIVLQKGHASFRIAFRPPCTEYRGRTGSKAILKWARRTPRHDTQDYAGGFS